ncbi:MAG: hypothetical protein ACLQIJ_06535 [Polyangia bacterium]
MNEDFLRDFIAHMDATQALLDDICKRLAALEAKFESPKEEPTT